ncbi:MAG: M24 family metallopeptidase [Anaerolineales bacterium]
MDVEIVGQKLDQAVNLLEERELSMWITFVRETSLVRDPALDLIYPFDVTWQSAFIVTADGERIAVVGRFDTDTAAGLNVFSQVIGYDESIRPALIEIVRKYAAGRIGINTSASDPAADGLTVGLHSILLDILDAAGCDDGRVVSAEGFLASLRGRKTAAEVNAIRTAIDTTERLYDEVDGQIKPGISERQLAAFLHGRVAELGLGYAWDRHADPIVNTGPESIIGHAAPSDLTVSEGHLVHFDFGIRENGFCSDLQRMWYVLAEGESEPPEIVQRAFDDARHALLAGAAALKPGALGWHVDEAARQGLRERDRPLYQHAFGHHVGRVAHDGATVLGPRWDRYGQTPYGVIEAGNVFAIELEVEAAGHGWVALEENVLVTDQDVEWLSTPQESLRLIS